MTSFTVSVRDEGVRTGLRALADRMGNAQPMLQAIGDDIVERAKRRFETSTGPDGQPWKPNATATLDLVAARIGKGGRKKDGALNARGQRQLAGKKPLIGESSDLRRQIVAIGSGASVQITSSPVYAAIQQFGGKAGRGHQVTIPARPFLPIKPDGSLYPAEQAEILAEINRYLTEGL